jgi:SMC interacting uncharacterized protein involved in chromosome segregation
MKSFNLSETDVEDLYQKVQSLTISMEKSKGKIVDTEYTLLIQEREKLLARLNEAKKKLDNLRKKIELLYSEEDGVPTSPTASFVGINPSMLSMGNAQNASASDTHEKMEQ